MKSFLDDYEPVEDRLRRFWTDHPYGRVITELLYHSDGDYIVKASVYFGNELRNDPPTATGLAHDSVSALPANMKQSALEVCETSAIGRALANAGYAAKDKQRPSREETAKARPGGSAPSPGAGTPPGDTSEDVAASASTDAAGPDGGRTVDSGEVATATGDTPSGPASIDPITNATLNALLDVYGTPNKAKAAAKGKAIIVGSLGELTEEQGRELLAAKVLA